jgi:hypothetical protein
MKRVVSHEAKTTNRQSVLLGGSVNTERGNTEKATDGNGSGDLGASAGQPSEAIVVHWSCAIPARSGSLLTHGACERTGSGSKPARANPVELASCEVRVPVLSHRAVVVAVGSGNGVGSHSLLAITPPHFPVLSPPHWDRDRRELWFDGMLIKRFRQPSPSQENILTAFQEEGWPPSIDDPLPQDPEQEPKRRLNHTIRNLNRLHKSNRIRFVGDGSGERVMWKRVLAADW